MVFERKVLRRIFWVQEKCKRIAREGRRVTQ
jgi:hypothetical protein